MKQQIRYKVFESNSSSCHSISIRREPTTYDYDSLKQYIDQEDNKIHIPFGEFGWGVESYNDSYTKLQYALTMVVEGECYDVEDGTDPEEYFYNTKGFKLINELIKLNCNCGGCVIENPGFYLSDRETDRNGRIYRYVYHNGYIDHQSVYESLDKFINYECDSLEGFIFDTTVYLNIDNDNH